MAIDYEAAFVSFIAMVCSPEAFYVALAIMAGMFSFMNTFDLFLPLPQWVPAIATLLSIFRLVGFIIVDIIIMISTASAENNNRDRLRHTAFSVIAQVYSVLTIVIATIALTYIFPENVLLFRMEQQWQSHFESRNAEAIRTIQDRFKCCGLLNTKDRAWPFNDHNYGDDMCQLQLGYQSSCLMPWSKAQRYTSLSVLAAALVLWGMKFAFVYLGPHPSSWMRSKFHSSRKPADYQRITAQPKSAEKGGVNVNDKGSE